MFHGYYGYLPTPRQHKLGGYETWLGTNRLETEASDKLLAELLAMAKELKRRTAKTLELQSLNPSHADRTLAAADVAWIARIVWASQ